jgi:hypothetical protein
MTMNRTEGGRCLRIAWNTCLAILGALSYRRVGNTTGV